MDDVIVVGAKGFAKSILFSFPELEDKFVFFDDISEQLNFYNGFKIIRSQVDLVHQYPNGFNFVIGVGGVKTRKLIYNKFKSIGGIPKTLISKNAKIGKYDISIGEGSIILCDAQIPNSIAIGKGCLINRGVYLSHDNCVGDFCELAPRASIMGHVKIKSSVFIGASATVIPRVMIGDNAIIGAGSVVINNVESNTTVVGNPACVKKVNHVK